MIRKAMIQDQEDVADLVLMASALVFKDILETDDYQTQKDFLMSLYERDDTKYSMNNILVYTINEEVAGCLVYYASEDETLLNNNLNNLLTDGYNFKEEAAPNSIYLDSLAVFNKYQGQGISRKLLEYAINNFESDLSLLVETYKEHVQSYYERMGFEVIKKVEMFNGELNLMIYKR